ncbi:MAG TPA: cytochrome C biogenesis protein [Allosphingosinicella sp.]|nr:cytochrome C biogenesis protein [Allosphingosinicella sp.]
MMGWVVMVALAAALGAALWRFAGFRGPALQLLAAAMLLAMAGYAWQGRPALGSQPKQAGERQKLPETPFATLRGEFVERFDYASRWLIIADGYQRRGDTKSAVAIIKSGLRARPRNSTLWTGLGNALVLHGGGTMNPAAELAYRRALVLAPEHPAPRFFYGMSLIQSGDLAAGERAWRELLASAPARASWRPVVAERLAIIEQLKAMGQAGVPAR